MSRKLTKVDFARVWEVVPKLSKKDWDELVARRQEVASVVEPKKRESRKPKGGPAEVAG